MIRKKCHLKNSLKITNPKKLRKKVYLLIKCIQKLKNFLDKSDEWAASVNLFKGLIGIGILSLPYAFSKGGWLFCMILIPVCGYLMYFCSQLMLQAADHMEDPANNIPHNLNKNITCFCENTLGPKSIPIINFFFFTL